MRRFLVLAACLVCLTVVATGQIQHPSLVTYISSPTDGTYTISISLRGSDGNLYGVESEIGFIEVDTTTDEFVALNSNGDLASMLLCFQGGNGNLYGLLDGELIELTLEGTETTFANLGSASACPILGSDGNYYGGTSGESGTLFKVSPAGEVSEIYSFAGGSAGTGPIYSLLEGSDDNFYGVSATDFFRYSPTSGTAVDFSIGGLSAPPIEGPDGNFYDYSGSAIYKITPQGGVSTLWTVPAGSEASSIAQVFLGGDQNLYVEENTIYYSSLNCGYPLSAEGNYYSFYPVSLAGTLGSQYFAVGYDESSGPTSDLITLQMFLSGDGNYYGTDLDVFTYSDSGMCGGWEYDYVIGEISSAPPTPPIQVAAAPSTVVLGSPTTLSFRAYNAFSNTMQQCFAFSTSGGGATPLGKLTGSMSGGVYSGSMSYTPSSAGEQIVAVVCGGQEVGLTNLTVNMVPPLTISTALLPTSSVGIAYSTTLQATGGTPPYKWSVSAGTLPAGLSLSSAGVISGKPTTAATSNFTVEVTDSASHTATQALSITVLIADDVRITTTSLPNWTVGKAYSATMAATSGTKPYAWSVYSGSLPTGLAINASSGVISGNPTTVGTWTFLIGVKGAGNNTATAQFTVVINAAPVVGTTLLETGAVGYAYATQLSVEGGTAPYAWTVSAGSLPAGLSLNAATGEISGKPTAAVVANFTVEVTDAAGVTATQALSLTIYVDNDVRITTTSLPGGTVGTAYSATLEATSGTKPYTWSVYSGSLPAGLSLAASTGVISGTPTTAGTTNFFIGVKGAGNNTATASLSITVAQ